MTGKVYLVGAGPGDPKLITLRAVELLKEADVVLYDRLVSKKIISMIPKRTKVIYVGRAVGDDTKHQDGTNELMVKNLLQVEAMQVKFLQDNKYTQVELKKISLPKQYSQRMVHISPGLKLLKDLG